MKGSLIRLLKFGLLLSGLVLIGILTIFGFAIFQVRTTLNLLSETRNSFENVQIKMLRFQNHATSESSIVDVKKTIHEKSDDPRTNRNNAQDRPQEKAAFKIEGLIAVLSSELGDLDLCQIQCDDLKQAIEKIRDYSRGNIRADVDKDQAFQLAIRMNQAGFGPAGREALSLIYHLQSNPASLKSIGSLSRASSELSGNFPLRA